MKKYLIFISMFPKLSAVEVLISDRESMAFLMEVQDNWV
jgi:hypothetical protein